MICYTSRDRKRAWGDLGESERARETSRTVASVTSSKSVGTLDIVLSNSVSRCHKGHESKTFREHFFSFYFFKKKSV